MKKILLVGKLNKTLEELYDSLSRRFQVQVSAEPWKIVGGMLQITKPDMVVLNIMDLEDIEENVFRLLENSYAQLPVLVLGSVDGCDKYQQFRSREQVSFMNRSINKQELIQVCYQKLEGSVSERTAEEEEEEQSYSILIVDDSPVTLRGIKAMLDKDYTVSVATSGEQALKSIKKKRPDLVLLDYEMPGWDGRETLEKIREDAEISDTPVIFLTGVADKDHIAAVLKLSPAGYLLKPAEKEKLIGTIEEVLKGNIYG